MTALMEWRPAAAVHVLAVQLYLDRLARLMQLDVADGPALSAEEQRRLRTRAIVGTIETLTSLGAGSSASHLLRAARSLDPCTAPLTRRTALPGDWRPDSEPAIVS